MLPRLFEMVIFNFISHLKDIHLDSKDKTCFLSVLVVCCSLRHQSSKMVNKIRWEMSVNFNE